MNRSSAAAVGGPGGPRADKVAAAVADYLRGRKAGRVPDSVPRGGRGSGKGGLHGDTGGCSSPDRTRHAADAGGMGAREAGAVPGIKARVLSGDGHGSGIPPAPGRTGPPASRQSGRYGRRNCARDFGGLAGALTPGIECAKI